MNIIMRKALFILFAVFMVLGCDNEKRYYDNVHIKTSHKETNRTITKLEKVIIKPKVTSGIGFFCLEDSLLLFFDEMFCTVSAFDLEGVFQYQKLGIGKGPNEISALEQYIRMGRKRIINGNWMFYVFDDQWNKVKMFTIDWNDKHSDNELLNHPDFSFKDIYNVDFFANRLITDGASIFLKLEFDHPKVNIFNSAKVYKDVFLFGKMDPRNGKIIKLYGRYPKIYRSYNFIPQFSHYYYDNYKNNDFVLGFEADSLIYICDHEFYPKIAFGIKGKMKNTKYIETTSYKETVKIVQAERKTKGYYGRIKYVKEKDLLFRIYTTGKMEKGENRTRMQIYHSINLISDVPVPDDFKIIGYIEPYFYADGYYNVTEDTTVLGVYKFKILQ